MARPFYPSNGTEGEIFMSQWCHCCVLDRASREEDDPANGCEILANALAAIRPEEWIIGDDNRARCTAFELDEGQEHLPIDPDAVIRPLL